MLSANPKFACTGERIIQNTPLIWAGGNSTQLFTNPLMASPLAFTASLPKQKHSCTKSRQLRRLRLLRVCYSLAVWVKPILSAGLWFHSQLSGGLRLRNYRAVAENHKFSSRFSVFACFHGGYSNRVKRLTRLSG